MRTVWASTTRHAEMNDAFAQWASMKLFDGRAGFGPCTTMAVVDGDNLVAVVVYHNYHAAAGVVEMSAVATDRRWLTRPVLLDMFGTPFSDMKCQCVVMRVSPKPGQRHVRRMLRAYGFSEHRLPRLRGRHEDECVLILTDDAWQANGFHRSTDFSPARAEKAA